MPLTLSDRHQARVCAQLVNNSENFLYKGDFFAKGQNVLLCNLYNARLFENFIS